jgi:hypothetical protein
MSGKSLNDTSTTGVATVVHEEIQTRVRDMVWVMVLFTDSNYDVYFVTASYGNFYISPQSTSDSS